MIKIVVFFILSISALGNNFEGYWLIPSGKTVILIRETANEYSGHVVWLKTPLYPKGDPMEGKIQVDRNNPDPNLRNRKVMGLKVVGDMRPDPKNTYKLRDGWVYDSWHGKKYYGQAVLADKNTLKLRGSLDPWGILGYSQKCSRITDPEKYGLLPLDKNH